MSPLQKSGFGQSSRRLASGIQWLVSLFIIFLFADSAVPGINESHYLPKAKAVWDSHFAPGDLFLESHDSHFLTSLISGLSARIFPLTLVAWLGRAASWGLLAWAWQHLCNSLRLPGLLGPLALASWLLWVDTGHWAGEWIVGGFEAKTLAYPLVLFGLSYLVRGQWAGVWLTMGGAMAWHPVVGGWAGLCAGCVWLLQQNWRLEFSKQFPWLLAGAGLALLGVIPALIGMSGPDVVERVSAAQVHVYMRLSHHLSPQLFATNRHWAAVLSLALFAVMTIIFCKLPRNRATAVSNGQQRLLTVGWLAVLLALIGWGIDWTMTQSRPDIAARLLRFYWFRWADVAVPLVGSLLWWKWLMVPATQSARVARLSESTPHHSTDNSDRDSFQPRGRLIGGAINDSGHLIGGAIKDTAGDCLIPKWLQPALLLLTIVVTALGAANRIPWDTARIIPAADQLVVESVGRNSIATDRYIDWLAVCQWIREHTPHDSLWFTPKYQQTFKWYAGRAEVVCWKDVPQDNASVIEWYHRIERCAPPRDDQGQIADWTTEQLLELSAQYGFGYVLLDRSFQSHPPALEIVYPVMEQGLFIDNRSFAIFRIPDELVPHH